MTGLRIRFQDKTIAIPHADDYPESLKLTNELHTIEREVSESNLIKYHHQEGKHDDFAMMLAMAVDAISGVEQVGHIRSFDD